MKPMKIHLRPLFVVVFFLLSCSASFGSRPQRWVTTTQTDFLEGEFRGVAVSSEGRLNRAPALEFVFDTRQAYIHSAAADRSGVVYLGTGSDGKIFRLAPGESGREFVDLEESGVFALAVDRSNRLYAATSPDGHVYRINSQGQAETFSSVREKYLWDLAFDSEDNLYVATGPKGIIYKIDSSGNATSFYDSDEIHIVRLALDIDGNLLAGTAPGGKLLRLGKDGSASVLLDSELQEIKGIASDRYGNIYAAALSFEAAPEKDSVAARPRALTIGPLAKTEDAETVELEGTRRGKKLELYRVSRNGLVDILYSEDESMAFDLLVRPDLTVLMATSDRGRVVSVDQQRFLKLLAQSRDDQVTRLVQAGEAIYAMTSNLGKVYRLGGEDPSLGVFESKVLDAVVRSQWGRIAWKQAGSGGPAPRLYTRSGNTKEPDRTWSQWSGPYEPGDGAAIQSPANRFLQWKAEFPGDRSSVTVLGTALDSVVISYLQENVAPRISRLTVHSAGSGFIKQPVAPPPGSGALGGPDQAHALSLPIEIRNLESPQIAIPPRPVYIPGARSFSWEASDLNLDELQFSVHIRAEDETEWKTLVEETTETHYTLDGTSLADGSYLFQVRASDRPSNPPEIALESTLTSRPFLIGNRSPMVEVETPRISGSQAAFQVRTGTGVSSVYQTEYSVDSGPWRILYPEDGIADSRQETYEIRLEGLSRGEHSVMIRVVDSLGNIGTARATLTVP